MATTSLFFDIFGRDQGVGKTFDEIGSKGKTMGASLKGVGAGMAAGLAALTGVVLKTGFDKLKEQSAGAAQLEAGIKSTGNAAHVSVGGLNDLADSIQNYSGQTNDSIAGAESLLLTFTNIKNVGANKIFDETTAAAADMAAKLGTDAAPQAMLLGKALQDPATGLTRLMRAGVSFTGAQKEQIVAMQKSGNIMGAQKIILGEVSKEFGGAAKAAGSSLPGELKKSDNAFKDMSAGLTSALMPALVEGAKLMTGVAQWATKNQPLVKALAAVVAILAAAFVVLSAAATIAASPFIAIGLGVAVLIAGLVLAYNKIGWFKDGVNAVVGFITAAFKNIISFIQTVLVPIWTAEFNIIATVVKWIYSNVIAPTFNLIKSIVQNVVNFFTGTVVPGFKNSARWIADAIIGAVDGFNKFKDGVSSAIGKAVDFVTGIPGKVKGVFSDAGTWLTDAGDKIMSGLADGITGAWHKVTDFVGTIAGWIKDHKGPLSYDAVLLKPAGEAIMGGFHQALKSGMPAIAATMNGFTADIGGIGGHGSGLSATAVARQISNTGTRGSAGSNGPMTMTGTLIMDSGEVLGTFRGIATQEVHKGINAANQDLGRRPSR